MLVSVTDDRQGSGHQQRCRRYRSPCLVMPPNFSLPPLEFCRGTSPIQAARALPDLKAVGSGTVATMALASTGPTPGTSINRQPNSVDRALDLTRRSFSSTWSFTSPNWQTNGASEARATAGTRSSSGLPPGDGDQSLNAIAAHWSH